MSNSLPDPSESPTSTIRQAEILLKELDYLRQLFAEAYEADSPATPPPLRVDALFADAEALAEGIRDGTITTSQPRIATNLIEAVGDLQKSGNELLAMSVIPVVGLASKTGIAADNSAIGRARAAGRGSRDRI